MNRMAHPFMPSFAPGVDPAAMHGIYRWDLDDIGVYIGKFTHPSRPTMEYSKNVNRWLDNLPYRPTKPDGWRVIHRAIRLALQHGKSITLTIVENCPPDGLNARERQLIALYGTLNGRRGSRTLTEAAARLSPVGVTGFDSPPRLT